jgi:hypothetical protein
MHMHLGGVVYERLLRTGGGGVRYVDDGRDLDERVDRCY